MVAYCLPALVDMAPAQQANSKVHVKVLQENHVLFSVLMQIKL
jgi:hypothetical protein